jgi:hypothetical protein
LLPLDVSLFIDCLKSLFRVDDSIENKRCIWSELVNFSSELEYEQFNMNRMRNEFYDWLMQNTDLKCHKHPIYFFGPYSGFSIWM